MRRFQWLAIATGIVCLFIIGHSIDGDGAVRFQALQSFFDSQGLGPMRYSAIGPLFALPLITLDHLLGLSQSSVQYFNFLIFLMGLGAFWKLLRPVLDLEERFTFILLMVFGSLFPIATKGFYGETFSAVTIGMGLVLLARDKMPWAGLLMALGTANSPALIVPLALLICFRSLEEKTFRPAWILALAAGLILAERGIRFHDLLHSEYEDNHGYKTFMPFSGEPGFSYPFLLGLLSIFFSFGKGLLFFFPGLWAFFWKTKKDRAAARERFARYSLVFIVGMVTVYAKWWSWYGGWYWGPRFFLFCSVPASYFLAIFIRSAHTSGTKAKKFLALFALAAAFWVCLSGLLFGQTGLDLCYANNYALESACWYTPEFSPIFRPLVMHETPVEHLRILMPTWIFALVVIGYPILGQLFTAGKVSLARKRRALLNF